MFGSQTLDVAIGLIFVYILASIICTAVREGLEAWMKTRSVYLEHGIRELLQTRKGGNLAEALYDHPLVSGLFSGEYKPTPSTTWRPLFTIRNSNLPSYIPSKNFSLALMDIVVRGPKTGAESSGADAPVISLDTLRANVAQLENPAVQRVLLTAIDSAQGDINRAQANIEAWFDSAMDRVSGWYKRSTQWILFAIGLAVAVGVNINTITVVDFLYHNDAARAAIVARAGTTAQDASYAQAKGDLQALGLPVGWDAGWGAPKPGAGTKAGAWNNAVAPVLGWLLTALAATLGAPFWFDVLNKVMVIRSTVKPHEKSPEEASEDRQLPAERMSLVAAGGAGAATAGVPQAGAAAAAPPSTASIPAAPDPEADIDGCDVEIEHPTPDEALPAAKGGVA